MKEPKNLSDYARNSYEFQVYFHRYSKLPDMSKSDWFESPDDLTEEILKNRRQLKASHLKTAIPLDKLIHWIDVDISREFARQLGIPIGRRETLASLNVFCANLYQIACLGQSDVMSMSFNNNSYRKDEVINPLGVTRSIINVAKAFVCAGHLREHTGFYDPSGRKSRNTALELYPDLIDRLLGLNVPNVTLPVIEPIRRILRTEDGKRLPLLVQPESLPDSVKSQREFLLLYNEFIRDYQVTVTRPNVREFHDAIAFHMTYYGHDCGMHSRINGGRYQTMRKDIRRPYLQINGEPTVEVDLVESHPTILYALAGHPLIHEQLGRAYWLTDQEPPHYEREAVKKGMACMLNVRSEGKAISAITHAENTGEIDLGRSCTAKQLIEQILSRHSRIADQFFKPEVGMKCMETEGKIMLETMRWGMQNNVLVLPLHDAVICRQSDSGRVAEALREASCSVLGKPMKVSVKEPK